MAFREFWVLPYLLCIYFVFVWSDDVDVDVPTAPIDVRVNNFQKCPDHLDVPSTYDNLTLYMDPETNLLYVSGELNLKEPIPVETYLFLDFRRCYQKSAESCEKYTVAEIPDICSHLPDETKAWTSFIKHVENLDVHCPIKAGSYKMIEAPLNMSFFEDLSDFIGHWNVEIAFKIPDKFLGCMIFDMEIKPHRGG